MKTNKEIFKICVQNGFLLDKDLIELLSLLEDSLSKKLILSFLSFNPPKGVIGKKIFIENSSKILSLLEKEEDYELARNFFYSLGVPEKNVSTREELKEEKKEDGVLKILFSPRILPKKVSVQDFIGHFRARYEQIKSILLDKNLENLKSLRRIGREVENYHVIVCIFNKRITKNGNIVLDVEDLNGSASVIITKTKKELFDKAKDLLLDEVIAIGISGNSEALFANEIIHPDAVLLEKKKSSKEEIVAFISDIHLGSKMFFEEKFIRFINWLNGEEGDAQQREISKKVKYLLIIGDSVDGVGVYPDQEKSLLIKDLFEQYKKLYELLAKIRSDIEIIICPGQHDAVWVGEPQPAIDEKWAPDIFKMKNVSLVTNPALIQLRDNFRILMYHGASMHGIIEEIEEIRIKYGHRSPTRVVKEMLKRRHLSPIHGSCDYIPNEKRDLMLIDILPDIVCTGDQHRPEISTYNNILLIASSCWQDKTPFEEKVGHEPDPCKVPIFNLKTREVKILDFFSKQDESN